MMGFAMLSPSYELSPSYKINAVQSSNARV
jgi:hypothetical protein